ncbi:MAG: DUF362 domain-containing protein [Chloroflexota bacterium]
MPTSSHFSRKDFLRLTAAGLGALAAAPLLSACEQADPTAVSRPDTPVPASITSVAAVETVAPAASPTPLPTRAPSATPTLAFTPRPLAPLPDLVRRYPAVSSKVVQTHHAGVWSGKTLVPGALRQMVDASLTQLTGLNDAKEAWAALFKPGERIAIKVNVFRNSLIWTHLPLVTAVTDGLIEAGIPAENIVIFDYQTTELQTAAYPVNVDGPGVRVYGNDEKDYEAAQTQLPNKKKIRLSNILLDCDAIINMPVLKAHMMAGLTFALKNHYGSFYYPDVLHSGKMLDIAELNDLPILRDRTRLVIGDALAANLHYANRWPYWEEDWWGDSILMSFDPVAHDSVGLQLLSRALEADGGNPASLQGMANPYLQYAAELGLGTNDPANMVLVETSLK